MLETEGGRKMTECRPELIAEYSREAGSVVSHGETPAGLPDVIILEESIARPTQGPKIRTGMTKNPGLPDRIEAFDSGVAAGFFRRNEAKMDAQQEVKTDDLGETAAIPSSSRRGHLVVHLGDPGKPHNSPGINQMTTKRDRSLVTELAGRCGLAGDIKGVDGVEAGDSSGPSEMTGPDQVGLLKVAHRPSSDVRIGRPIRSFTDFDLSGPSGSGQYLFDGRDGRERLQASFKELVMDRFGSDPSKGRSPGLMSRQFIADREDFADNRIARPVRDVDRGPTSIEEPLLSEFPVAAQPFREPGIAPLDSPLDDVKADSIFMKANRLDSEGMFAAVSHPLRLLPNGMGRSLRDNQNAS